MGAPRLTKLQKGENVRLELSFFLASAGFAKEKVKKIVGNNQKEPYQSTSLRFISIIFSRNCN